MPVVSLRLAANSSLLFVAVAYLNFTIAVLQVRLSGGASPGAPPIHPILVGPQGALLCFLDSCDVLVSRLTLPRY